MSELLSIAKIVFLLSKTIFLTVGMDFFKNLKSGLSDLPAESVQAFSYQFDDLNMD